MSSDAFRSVDGFDVVQALKRAQEQQKASVGGGASLSPTPPSPVPSRPPPAAHADPRIGHTIVPEKRVVRCYECRYEFPLTAKLPRTYCPKCRTQLEIADVMVDGEWGGDSLRTAGTVHIGPGGAVRNGTLVANEVIVEGLLEGGSVEAIGTLDIRTGAQVSAYSLSGRRLKIGAGMALRLTGRTTFQEVEVGGTLEADLEVKERMHILAAGHFIGRVHTRRLCVEEGGGLSARVFAWPSGAPETADASPGNV